MNYAQIVKCQSSKVKGIEQIRSQAEMDLGKKLSESEEILLLSRDGVSQLCQRITKVLYQNPFFLTKFIEFSMDMAF